MSEITKFKVTVPRKKRRAIELYHEDSPFWPKVARTSKKDERQKNKHRNSMLEYI